MTEPAPYSQTDAAEQDAVNVFKQLIDTAYVKDDIKTRDKHPNIDGSVELVDDRGKPIGKFDVQIKKIPEGAVKYSCPATLIGYSNVSILPVILICVDVKRKKAYWKKICSAMPEYKPDQGSFTVDFDTELDTIDGNRAYLSRWRGIVEDHKERIARYPELLEEIANKVSDDRISPKDMAFFQRFIDRINDLFDNDFCCVKRILLPNVWKVGVAIYRADANRLSYKLYRAPYKLPIPLVCAAEGKAFDPKSYSPLDLSDHLTTREYLGEPEKAGEAYVLDCVKQVVSNRDLSIYGVRTCVDFLLDFVKQHGKSLALPSEDPEYALADLSRAISLHYARLHSTIAPDIQATTGGGIILFSSSIVSRKVHEAIDYLRANNISAIKPLLKPRSLQPSRGSNWSWSGYTAEDERHNVFSVLETCIREYTAFVRGNGLVLPKSMYLDRDTSVVFVYERSAEHDARIGPVLQEYLVDNAQGRLPKLLVIFADSANPRVIREALLNVRIDGTLYSCNEWSGYNPSFLFERTPFLRMSYRMLCHDLNQHYNLGLTRGLC